MKPIRNTDRAIRRFCTAGTFVSCEPYGNGHINDTYLVIFEENGQENHYILQALNTNVFKKPEGVMANIQAVTEHLGKKSEDPRSVLTLVKTRDGAAFYADEDGAFWRMYDFVTDSICLERPESPADFYECAVAFGKFQKDLSDFAADTLFETIPDFHNTPKRFADFCRAVQADVCDRVKTAQEEIAFVMEREDFYGLLLESCEKGALPLRVSHNDTKSNNVMLDAKSRTALCVIDLDTIMPGFSVTDFGDSIRFGANTAAEDEKDLGKVSLDLNLFKTYTEGFLKGCGGSLPASEILLLPEGAKMMTIECGMRFLADYLEGDVYFKTAYPEHNLIRSRTQFKLVAEMEKHWDELKAIVKEYC